MSPDSVLVVDDEKSWRDIYEAAARRAGVTVVRAVATLDEALTEVAARQFSVAIVDIGLNEDDDANIDGLAILSKIRSMGDNTSILVVTGRAGQDVISIISDAIKKYGAQETMAKSIIEPKILRRAVEIGLDTYRDHATSNRISAYSVLRGDSDQMVWDDRMMRALGFDARELYAFVGKLVGSFLPLLPNAEGPAFDFHAKDELAHAPFWSRAIGAPVAVLIGRELKVTDAIKMSGDNDRLLNIYDVAEIITTYSESGVKGVVFKLAGSARGEYISGI